MDSRTSYLLAWTIFLIIVFLCFNVIKRRKALFNFCLVCILILFLFGGGSLINLNSFVNDRVNQIQAVIDQVGDTYIKTENGFVYIKVGNDWINVDDIKIVGEFTKDVTINYKGQDIYIGHSGVYNTIKVLEDTGLIRN